MSSDPDELRRVHRPPGAGRRAIRFCFGSLVAWVLWLAAVGFTGGGLSHPSDQLPGGPFLYLVITLVLFLIAGGLAIAGILSGLASLRERRTPRP